MPLGLPAAVVALLVAGFVPALAAQGVMQRTPNIEDGWTVRTGVLQFNFLHRFTASEPPPRKVTNFPTFNLATGLPANLAFGVKYATNSTLFPGIPNEYEIWFRSAFLRRAAGAPLDVALTAAYNAATESGDGELTLARGFGPLRLLGAVRGMSSGYDTDRALFGAGGGAVLRLTSWLGLAGDFFAILSDEGEGEDFHPAWGAGAQIGIPFTPHTLSIQIVNTNTGSIQGSARGVEGEVKIGFEFTIPITLSRYFGVKSPAPRTGAPADSAAALEPPAAAARVPPADSVAEVRIESFAFGTPELRVQAGTRVRWTNADPVQHTVTANDGAFDSGLLDSWSSFERVFEKAGTYAYHCIPHPFMQAKVIVE